MTTYKQSGVNIYEAEKLVEKIKPLAKKTFKRGVMSDIGFFGAFYDARFNKYKHPVLVSSVDGVGTKVKIAIELGRHDTIGQDLVNHCVNDIAVGGADPLFFLDYFACGKLKPNVAAEVIKGLSIACLENGFSLIGGETAEMPGVYAENDYDLAGTIVGVVEKSKVIDGRKIRKGDILVGLPSNGLHTNGFSLARRVLLKEFSLNSYVPELRETLGEHLLKIHRTYLKIIRHVKHKFPIHGMVHVTGGGITGNTIRVVRPPHKFRIVWDEIPIPPIFMLIQQMGKVPSADMRRTFNLGVGLLFVIPESSVSQFVHYLNKMGEDPIFVGEVTA